MVDETKDVSKKEQISVVLATYTMMTFMKSFLILFQLMVWMQSLLVTVKGALAKFNIDKNACV